MIEFTQPWMIVSGEIACCMPTSNCYLAFTNATMDSNDMLTRKYAMTLNISLSLQRLFEGQSKIIYSS